MESHPARLNRGFVSVAYTEGHGKQDAEGGTPSQAMGRRVVSWESVC